MEICPSVHIVQVIASCQNVKHDTTDVVQWNSLNRVWFHSGVYSDRHPRDKIPLRNCVDKSCLKQAMNGISLHLFQKITPLAVCLKFDPLYMGNSKIGFF